MKIKKTLKIIAGIIAILLGFLGFFLPLTPGWAFIFVGIILISPEKGKKLVTKIKEFARLKKKEKKKRE